VIVVGRIHSHPCAGNAVFAERHACDDRFFGEGAVAVVAIKLIRLGIILKQKIGQAVIVEIEDGDTESF